MTLLDNDDVTGYTPVALTTSVTQGGSDYSWTLVQGIRSSHSEQPATNKEPDAAVTAAAEAEAAGTPPAPAPAATPARAGNDEQLDCRGGNIMYLASNGATAQISRTGLEGLAVFQPAPPATEPVVDNGAAAATASAGKAPHDFSSSNNNATRYTYTADDWSLKLQSSETLSSQQDTDSTRACALMHGCSNDTSAALVYWCFGAADIASALGTAASVDYQVSVRYTISGAPAKVSKAVVVCKLTPALPKVARGCDASVTVGVASVDLWAGIKPPCTGVAC